MKVDEDGAKAGEGDRNSASVVEAVVWTALRPCRWCCDGRWGEVDGRFGRCEREERERSRGCAMLVGDAVRQGEWRRQSTAAPGRPAPPPAAAVVHRRRHIEVSSREGRQGRLRDESPTERKERRGEESRREGRGEEWSMAVVRSAERRAVEGWCGDTGERRRSSSTGEALREGESLRGAKCSGGDCSQ